MSRVIHTLIVVMLLGMLLYATGKVWIKFPSGKEIIAEKAASLEERARGLMYREKLNDNEGMIFIFEKEDFHSFWMKNMVISIDIIWLDKGKRVVYYLEDVPPCKEESCPSYYPMRKAKYVIEVMSGFVKREKVKIWDEIKFNID